jgi:hypothetical protein
MRTRVTFRRSPLTASPAASLALAAFILAAYGCQPERRENTGAATATRANVTWADDVVPVWFPNGSIHKIKARRGAGLDRSEVPAVVFINPRTRHVWANREMDFYIETGSRIVGIIQHGGGYFEWRDSLIDTAAANVDLAEVAARLEREVDSDAAEFAELQYDLVDLQHEVGLRDDLGESFFDEGRSDGPYVHVNRVTVNDGQLRLDLQSPSRDRRATVWIDLESRKATRAEERRTRNTTPREY